MLFFWQKYVIFNSRATNAAKLLLFNIINLSEINEIKLN